MYERTLISNSYQPLPICNTYASNSGLSDVFQYPVISFEIEQDGFCVPCKLRRSAAQGILPDHELRAFDILW